MKTICHNFYRKIIFNASALLEYTDLFTRVEQYG